MLHFMRIAVLTLSIAVLTTVQPARADVWQGSGQVVSGPGAGATVPLTVDYDGQNLKTLSGPTLEGSQVRIEQQGDSLELTLFRSNNQIVKYRLRRVSSSNDNRRSHVGLGTGALDRLASR